MTPRDSGEREVCGAIIARVNGNPLLCRLAPGHDGAHEAMVAEATAVIPLPLAQRILAALEGRGDMAERYALRDELRAAVERKT